MSNRLSMGEVYSQLHDKPQARAYFAQARAVASMERYPLRVRLQLSIVAAYLRAADTSQARSLLAETYHSIIAQPETQGNKKNTFSKERAYLLTLLSRSYLTLADTARARGILQEAQRLAADMPPGEAQFGTFYYIAEGYEQLADAEQAARIIAPALAMAEFIPAEDEKGEALTKLAQLATRLHCYKLAYAIISAVPADQQAELLFQLLEAHWQQQTGHSRPKPKAGSSITHLLL